MSAVLTPDGLYRYELRRIFDQTGGKVTWVLFNPSTADSEVNDPTISRCMDFSERWGFREMISVNLLPIRSPSPKEAWAWYRSHTDSGYSPPELLENQRYMDRATAESDKTIAAWGSLASTLGRAARKTQAEFWCLGTNADGQPKHPLYVPRIKELELLPLMAK